MKRVTSISKAMKGQQKSSNPTPILSNVKKVKFDAIPSLCRFLNSPVLLEDRKTGIYSLYNKNKTKLYWKEIEYKIKNTIYIIVSRSIDINNEYPLNIHKGHVKIIKLPLHIEKTFSLEDLPTEVVNSIDKNINKFNELYKDKKQKEYEKFFKNIDL